MAKQIGMSPKTYQRSVKIIEDGTEETEKRFGAGYPGTSIFKEYREFSVEMKGYKKQKQMLFLTVQN